MRFKTGSKQTRSVAFLAIFLLATASILFYLNVQKSEHIDNNDVERPQLLLRSPPIGGQEVTIEQAQSLVSFKIGLPANLGEPIQVKFDDQCVVIIWMETKPSQQSTLDDVRSHGGIILFEWSSTIVPQDHIEALTNETEGVEGALQKVTIKGYLGCAGGNVWHDVTWCTKTVLYELQANLEFPLQQLIEIARSIPQTNDLP
jgi:hypothetical protein